MKKTLAVLTLLAGAVSGYSQGQIYIGDYLKNDFQITIWSPQLSGPALSGNSSAAFANGQGLSPDVPSGNTVYSGTPLGGANTGATVPTDYANANLWSVQLYAGAGAGDNVLSLQPVSGAVANFYSNPASVGYPGLWNSTFNATISTATTGTTTLGGATVASFGVAGGSPVTLAIAAWYNGGGVLTSYNAALAAGVPVGYSSTGSINLGGGSVAPPDLPGPGITTGTTGGTISGGITSFSLAVVPEPSTIALGVIGASAFLMRLRRK